MPSTLTDQTTEQKKEALADLQAYWRGEPLPSDIRKAREAREAAREAREAASDPAAPAPVPVSETIKSETIKSETIKSETIKSETIKSETIKSETIKSEIPKWTPLRKGVVDGGFDLIGQDQAGTDLWGYYHAATQSGPSYFLASSTDRDGMTTATYCSCPSHFWAIKTGDTTHSCKHMGKLNEWIKGA